ncbi:glucose-6-phosphate dehydrogenase [Pediococcus acidilactici]|uniref:glucose-6-phosphate dehydrogenase n=1 Tax=Pediococcus acidilactici TaxID=1254 RepID=UPI0009474802|nr:glucose-6-phosphate dehydrogenase [Pediococcus acidilactici]APR28762.1 glucose-6-phosphate dehydrogenase [Pediococcus acidilactici]
MEQKALFIIFGGTGDLAYRKLYPALFNLYEKGYLKENFAVIGTARRPWSNDHYHEVVMSAIEDSGRDAGRTNSELPRKFASHFYYQSHNVDDAEHYVALRDLADQLDEKYQLNGNRIFYLAMAPRFFGTIAGHLKDQKLLTEGSGFNRLIIEKPFGRDYQSAKELNDSISGSFDEEQIFRIDHYLGKEPIQSIAGLRFGNALFNSLWNKEHIDNIQITLAESLGVEERAGYYETAGAMRDMLQNHIMQIVSLLTMERPEVFDSKHLQDKKIEALENIQTYSKEEAALNFVRGQYGEDVAHTKLAYREEEGTADDSSIETFVAGKLITHNPSLDGVPIYVRTGKRLAKKSTQINVVFKNDDQNIFNSDPNQKLETNVLTLHIEPDQGFTLQFNTKKGNQGYQLSPVHLRYRKSASEKAKTPDAYESLIRDALMGNKTNFAHWHEVRKAWQIVDVIRQVWDAETPDFPNYASGSMGPQAADDLLARDGRQWIFNPQK